MTDQPAIVETVPASTEAIWRAEVERIDAKLHEAGAVKVTADGFEYVDDSVLKPNRVGSSLATVYWGLMQMGFANGWVGEVASGD